MEMASPGLRSPGWRRVGGDLAEMQRESFGTETKINAVIADNIKLLRGLLGDPLETLYQEEFGRSYDPSFVEFGAQERDAEKEVEEEAKAKAKALGDRAEDLRVALREKRREAEELRESYEKCTREANAHEHRYGTLCSDFAKNKGHRMEHFNMLDKFNELSSAVRQANETREGLKQKLELRRQVLADADRINEVVASLDESGDLEPRGAGTVPLEPAASSARTTSTGALPGGAGARAGEGGDEGRMYFYADSAATALEMERLRQMMRKVGERLQEAEEERKAVSKATAMLTMELDRAEAQRRKALVEIALAQKVDPDPVATPAGSASPKKYFSVPDLEALRAESDRRDEERASALREQLQRRQRQREEAEERAREFRESVKREHERKMEEAKRAAEDARKRREEEEGERRERRERIVEMEAVAASATKADQDRDLARRRRVEELEEFSRRADNDKGDDEAVMSFVESLSPGQDKEPTTPESRQRTLNSVSPDSDFTFPLVGAEEALLEAEFDGAVAAAPPSAFGGGTPASEVEVEGIRTDLANRILSKTGARGSPSVSGTPAPRGRSPRGSPRRHLKVSPVTRMKVPKDLSEAEILGRLVEIERRREGAYESLETDDVHLIAQEELEEKVLRRRLRKLQRKRERRK